jgi:antirestriction protein
MKFTNITESTLQEAIAQAVADSDLDKAVFAAGLELGIPLDMIEETYRGKWRSDEEFAENYADGLGLLPENANWPTFYIDWEWAARELMYDFSEENGHYFDANY